jgi:hypothetical protein
MATTKSTVVGIRLDHERRAWVEAEAARLGVSVRGLFEGMIDEARSGEAEPAVARSEDSEKDRVREFRSSVDEVAVQSHAEGTAPSEQQKSARPGDTSRLRPTPSGPSLPGIGSVAGIPCGILRGAFSLTANVIETSGRRATNRLSSCVLTRRWVDRSL